MDVPGRDRARDRQQEKEPGRHGAGCRASRRRHATALARRGRGMPQEAPKEEAMPRTVVLLLAFLLYTAPSAAAPVPGWTPGSWVTEDTLDLTTDRPGEGAYTFPVWLRVRGEQRARAPRRRGGRAPAAHRSAKQQRRPRGGRGDGRQTVRAGALRAGARPGAACRRGDGAEVP